MLREQVEADVQFPAKHRIVVVEAPSHIDVLAALAGKDERYLRMSTGRLVPAGGGGLTQPITHVVPGARDGEPPLEGMPSGGESVGDVAQGLLGVGLDVVSHAVGHPGQGLSGSRGEGQQMPAVVFAHDDGGTVLFENDVRVGAADSE